MESLKRETMCIRKRKKQRSIQTGSKRISRKLSNNAQFERETAIENLF